VNEEALAQWGLLAIKKEQHVDEDEDLTFMDPCIIIQIL